MAATAKKRKPAAKKKAPADTKSQQHAKKQMWAVVLFAAGILLGALTFIKGDKLWRTLHDFLFGVFGWSVFFFAPLVIYIAVIAAMDRPLSTIKNKLWQVVMLIIMISGAIQIFGDGLPDEGGFVDNVIRLYEQGVSFDGGGVASGIFALPLISLFEKTGASIIISLCIFVFTMLVTGSTLIGLFKSAAKPVKGIEGAYAASVESRELRRQERAANPPKTPAATATVPSRFDFDVDISKDTVIDEDDGRIPWDNEPEAPPTPSSAFASPQPAAPAPEPEKPEMPVHPVVSEKPPVQKENPFDFAAKTVEYISPDEFAKRSPEAVNEPEPESEPEPVRRHSLDEDIDRAEREAAEQAGEIDDIIGRFVTADTEIPLDIPLPEASGDDVYDTGTTTDFDVPAEPDNWEEAFNSADLDNPEPAAEPESIPVFGEPLFDSEQPYVYRRPAISLLKQSRSVNNEDVSEELKLNAQTLVDTLKSFGVQTRITDICRGPAVTRYELQPSAGVKISKITGLSDDIALNLASAGIRIEAPIPNKAAVGIEVPNKLVSVVSIRELIDSTEFQSAESSVAVALGRDIAGNITLADIAKMPHILIAGSTGSGKSVCINSIIISLLYRSSPEDVKLLMIDPKVVELGVYNGIPHLLVPVVTDPKKAAGALNWAVVEMLRRYKEFAAHSVRDLNGYNRLAATSEDLKPMPKIVIIIDELADLMMAAPNDVEDAICRLAQMARAAGMHLVIATQRPSVDVITGVIKANIPSRIAFAVSSQVDSRTILDVGGAEKLLGRGDMLFYPVGAAKPQRVQGCFVTDTEVENVVEFIKAGEQTEYDQQIVEEIDSHVIPEKGSAKDTGGGFDDEDEMLPQAIECVVEAGQASTSQLQRRLKLGYARAARIIDQLEERGIVGPFEGSKPRQVLISKDRWLEMKLSGTGE